MINDEYGQTMEKNIFSKAREIEKLRAELAHAEKRARAAAAAAAATPSNLSQMFSSLFSSCTCFCRICRRRIILLYQHFQSLN